MPTIHFTFDDGPDPETTLPIVTFLNKHSCTATFFWLQEEVASYKENHTEKFRLLLQEIKEGDHEIGYHGPHDYQHSVKTYAYRAYTEDEFQHSLDAIERIIGSNINLYRPHDIQLFGYEAEKTEGLIRVGQTLSHTPYPGWSVESQVKWVSSASDGDIIIFHDGLTGRYPERKSVLAVVEQVAQTFLDAGYSIEKITHKKS